MHIGVFDVLNKVLFQKFTGDVSKNIFLQVFSFKAFAFKTLIFLCWPFLLLVLNFCVFSSLVVVVVVSQIKLLCSGFCFLLFWVSWVCLCVMCCVFLVGFCFFGGNKGQVRWPKGPPQLTLNPLCLFCFCFVSVCFVLVVGFVCVFFAFVSLEGFQGQLRWPFGPPHLSLKSCLVVLVVCFWFVFVCVGTNKKPCCSP